MKPAGKENQKPKNTQFAVPSFRKIELITEKQKNTACQKNLKSLTLKGVIYAKCMNGNHYFYAFTNFVY
jgi:hypothetical protein